MALHCKVARTTARLLLSERSQHGRHVQESACVGPVPNRDSRAHAGPCEPLTLDSRPSPRWRQREHGHSFQVRVVTSVDATRDRQRPVSNAGTQTTCLLMPDGATLLLVDDDPSVRRGLRRWLELESTSVLEAVDGQQAIRVIQRDDAQLLDAVLTNLGMPVVSGPELIAVLLECRPALPVVAMSGVVGPPPDLPPVPFLHKPFEPEELIATVAPLILQARAMRRRARQARADAAESRSLAARQLAIASEQMATSGDLMKALLQLRERG